VIGNAPASFDTGYFERYAGTGEYRDSRWKRLLRTRLIGRYLRGGSLLELGCAYGYLLRALQDRYQCEGIDISEHAIAVARTVTTATVECADVTQALARRADEAFDGVIAFDVLEHLPEDDIPRVLCDVRRVLRPGGLLFVSVPNTMCWSRRLKQDAWFGLRDATHVSLLAPSRWLELIGGHLSLVATGGDGLWDVPYLPGLPRRLQTALFGWTQALAAASSGRFPRPVSENLLVVAARR